MSQKIADYLMIANVDVSKPTLIRCRDEAEVKEKAQLNAEDNDFDEDAVHQHHLEVFDDGIVRIWDL